MRGDSALKPSLPLHAYAAVQQYIISDINILPYRTAFTTIGSISFHPQYTMSTHFSTSIIHIFLLIRRAGFPVDVASHVDERSNWFSQLDDETRSNASGKSATRFAVHSDFRSSRLSDIGQNRCSETVTKNCTGRLSCRLCFCSIGYRPEHDYRKCNSTMISRHYNTSIFYVRKLYHT